MMQENSSYLDILFWVVVLVTSRALNASVIPACNMCIRSMLCDLQDAVGCRSGNGRRIKNDRGSTLWMRSLFALPVYRTDARVRHLAAERARPAEPMPSNTSAGAGIAEPIRAGERGEGTPAVCVADGRVHSPVGFRRDSDCPAGPARTRIVVLARR